VLVPARAWPDDRFPHWAVAALEAAGARVSDSGHRGDVAVVPAVRPAATPSLRARRVIGLADVPLRPGDERLQGVDVVAPSAALAQGWPGARVVRPAVPPGARGPVGGPMLRVVSVGPLHWSAGQEHAVVAVARLLEAGTAVELRVTGRGPAREVVLFTAFDLGIERAVTVGGDEHEEVRRADVVVVPAVEDRAWTGLLRALACGVPVVASDLPTAREVGGAVLVPPRDPAALAAEIPRAVAGAAEVRVPTDLAACGKELLA
jgi:glycosyltransferase involved in cell wall biosynthesis